jgi:hypothetical protein
VDLVAAPDLSGYIEVHERIHAFYEKHPEGSLRGDWEVVQILDDVVISYRAVAYRTPDDRRPGIGHATEPYPGKTSFTLDSEVANAETSAWGRALAALGFEVKRGIASANEVRNRQGNGAPRKVLAMSAKQRGFFESLLKKQIKDDQAVMLVMDWAGQVLIGGRDGSASEAIDGLQNQPTETVKDLLAKAEAWDAEQGELPLDDADLPPVEELA